MNKTHFPYHNMDSSLFVSLCNFLLNGSPVTTLSRTVWASNFIFVSSFYLSYALNEEV